MRNKNLPISFDDYFSNANITITKNDINANKEKNYLFCGNLDSLDEWIKHEEFRLRQKNEQLVIELKRKNTNRSFIFSMSWLTVICIIIFVYGFTGKTNFKLSEKEFMFLIGTLSGTVMTYYTIVLRFIFK